MKPSTPQYISQYCQTSSIRREKEFICKQVVYPAAVLKASKNADAAKAFLSYLTTDGAMKVFEKVGFTAVTAA